MTAADECEKFCVFNINQMDIAAFLKNVEVKTYIKNLVGPLGTMVYNEIYIYIWFICIYNVFLIFLVLVNFVLLLKLIRNTSMNGPSSHSI